MYVRRNDLALLVADPSLAQGGPGCSSLGGFLLENGPISYLNTKDRPRKGANTWTQEANVIWVEQPVGTGFSQCVKRCAVCSML